MDSIGYLPENRNSAAGTVCNGCTKLYRNAFPTGTAATEVCEPSAADEQGNQTQGNVVGVAVGSVKNQMHALAAFLAVLLVDPDHQYTGER